VIAIICTILGVIVVIREYNLKKEVGYEFTPGDLHANYRDIAKVVSIAWVGGFIAAFCGVGPGMIFSPVLVIIGIEPRVGTATGMYISLFTALASSISVILLGRMNMPYSGYVQIMTIVASFGGIFFQNYMVTTSGRVSYQVSILFFCMMLCVGWVVVLSFVQ
jgi:uncharacterized membrane protein YfcA